MVLTARQQKAATLTRELQALGATVTNVLPLADGQNLRFWVSDYKKNELLQQLSDAGYEPVFTGMTPQVDVQTYSMGLVNVFELPIAAERQEVPQQDRVIPKDDVGKRKPSSEAQAVINQWYGVKRR
jgi:hypothetical protein